MSGSMEAYLIPKRLDEPERIAFWTIDEALALLGPILLGLFFGALLPGLIIGVLLWRGLKKFKGGGNANIARFALYWFLPDLFRFRVTPPSAIRMYV